MDLDDDELKATRNKFYKYNKDDFDKKHKMKIKELKDKIKEIRDKAELMDYYSLNDVIDDLSHAIIANRYDDSLNDVIDDLSKLIGDYEENE